jgi:amino-acid N-acetyltransferase
MANIRKARPADVGAMLALINDYAARGVMLPRTEFELCENLRDFTVAYEDDRLVGCGALHFYTPQTAELRSLAVVEHRKTGGVGRRVVEALLQEARDYGLDLVFAFTYVVGFFERCGFVVVDRGSLPLKAWKDCLRCPKFSCCDETAVVFLLSPGATAHTRLDAAAGLLEITPLSPAWNAPAEEPIRMPTPAAGLSPQRR